MSDDIILSPEVEAVAREFGAHFQTLYGRLGDAEARVGQLERLIGLRLNTKVMAVPGGDTRDAAELLEGIREGINIETVLLDVGKRLADLEYHCFAPKAVEQLDRPGGEGGAEEQPDGAMEGDNDPEVGGSPVQEGVREEG